MHKIEDSEVTRDFAECWKAAGIHIETQSQGGIRGWLRANLNPPFLEHLSFRLGNQLFFIQLVDVDDQLETPANPSGLKMIAEACQGHACYMPMQKRQGKWFPTENGWGLVDTETLASVNPIELITEEQIVMTDWELQDFAVQVVKDSLIAEGKEVTSWHGNPAVHPSLWFVGKDGLEWVLVKAARYPQRNCVIPDNINSIVESFKEMSTKEHFASVSVANGNDPFDPMAEKYGNFIPLYRGGPLFVSFGGLESL